MFMYYVATSKYALKNFVCTVFVILSIYHVSIGIELIHRHRDFKVVGNEN
jgi:hypothetical protein